VEHVLVCTIERLAGFVAEVERIYGVLWQIGAQRLLCDLAGERERDGVEEPPRRSIASVVHRVVVRIEHLADRLHADHVLAIEVKDGVGRLHRPPAPCLGR
jgi:hypothetical protein